MGERTKGDAPPDFSATDLQSDTALQLKSIVQICHCCGDVEENSCSLLRRKDEAALVWKMSSTAKAISPAAERVGQSWGPEVLWIPSSLREMRSERQSAVLDVLADSNMDVDDASPEDLGAWAS